MFVFTDEKFLLVATLHSKVQTETKHYLEFQNINKPNCLLKKVPRILKLLEDVLLIEDLKLQWTWKKVRTWWVEKSFINSVVFEIKPLMVLV